MEQMETIRKTSQKRLAILNTLKKTNKHPSAETIYESLRKSFPQISLGTVYRNLSVLRETGQIKSVAVVDGQERFDADTSRHTHFICDSCGEITDLAAGEDFSQSERIAREQGCSVTRHELLVYGECKRCCSALHTSQYKLSQILT